MILTSFAQFIEKNPISRYAPINSNVQFECKISEYDATVDLIEWCRNDFCTFGRLLGNDNDQRLQYKSLPKYFIVGNRSHGEWNLLIENVTQLELGEYKCQLTRKKKGNFFKLQSRSATLKLTSKIF